MIRLLIPLLIVVALMAYIGWHLWQMLPLSQGWRATVIAVCIGMVFLMVASIFGRNHLSETLIGLTIVACGTSLHLALHGVGFCGH